MKKMICIFVWLTLLTSSTTLANFNSECERRYGIFLKNLSSAQFVVEQTKDKEAKDLLDYFNKRAALFCYNEKDETSILADSSRGLIKDEIIPIIVLVNGDEKLDNTPGVLYRSIFLKNKLIEASYVIQEGESFAPIVLKEDKTSTTFYEGLALLHEIKHLFMRRNNQMGVKSNYPTEKETQEFSSRLLLKFGGPEFAKIANEYADNLIKDIEKRNKPSDIRKMYFLAPYYEINLERFFGKETLPAGYKHSQNVDFSILVTFIANEKIFKKIGLSDNEIAERQAMAISQRYENFGIMTEAITK